MPLLGFNSPGGAQFGLLWFGVVYPVSAIALGCAAWGLEALAGRLQPTAGSVAATVPSGGAAAPVRRRWADREPRTSRRILAEALAASQTSSVQGLVDPLSGLLSRGGLLAALAGVRGACSVALLDLDRLVHLTEHLGTEASERVLRQLAEVLRHGREGDLLARWSDTQLVLVLPLTTAAGAAARVGRLLDEVYAEVRVEGQPVALSPAWPMPPAAPASPRRSTKPSGPWPAFVPRCAWPAERARTSGAVSGGS
jgi:GGDEF domain-containing protein